MRFNALAAVILLVAAPRAAASEVTYSFFGTVTSVQTNRVHVATAGSRLNLGQNGCDLALCP